MDTVKYRRRQIGASGLLNYIYNMNVISTTWLVPLFWLFVFEVEFLNVYVLQGWITFGVCLIWFLFMELPKVQPML